jgi:polysaccharide pyruvyl transferase WcaK-like protein
VKKALSSSDFIGLRDEVSVNYCKEWDIKAYLGADMAYSSYFDYQITPKIIQKDVKKKIGIIVRDWVWEESGRAYFEPILKLYNDKNDNYDFQFIIYAPDKDPDWMKKLKGEDTLVWDPAKYSIQQFLDTMNTFDGFISARFHGAIIGALLGKPVISVEIEPKLRILTDDIKELLLWEKPFKMDELNNLLNNLDFKVDYTKSLNVLKTRAHFALDEFKELFDKKLIK